MKTDNERSADIYVVMRRSGKVMTFGSSLQNGNAAPTIFTSLLEQVYTEFQSAGSNYDPPHKLFKNGEEVIDGNLQDLAYAWGKDRQALREASHNWLQNKHTPDFAREQRAGSNPPGIDLFTITKKS